MFLLTVIALAIASAIGIAQNIDIAEMPVCAQGCLINETSEQTSCKGADVGCLCRNTDFINVVACCISSNWAISANVKLCGSVNVSIPNYLGCSPSLAEKFEASAATASRSTLNGQSTQINAAPTYLVTGTVQSAVTVPSTGPVAVFTGRAIFTGLSKRAPVSVVVTSQVYTLKYSLRPKKGGLSIGAKAGIGAGAGVAAIFGALFVSLVIHKRRIRSQGIKEGTIIGGDGKYYGPAQSDTFSQVGSHHPSHPADLPSPISMRQMPIGGGFWLPPAATERLPSPPPAPVPMIELPASTHIHEHHPMFQSSERDPESEFGERPRLVLQQNGEQPGSAGLVSPMEEADRR
ncbi:MAG: hypothetical protein Q9208_006338 [Pyrenodesmia sp. 3 TL-2023]